MLLPSEEVSVALLPTLLVTTPFTAQQIANFIIGCRMLSQAFASFPTALPLTTSTVAANPSPLAAPSLQNSHLL